MTKDTFQQKLRDGESLGIPRATTYKSLKDKGYKIEGEPTEQASVEKSGGVIGYFGDTMKSALRELGSVAKGAAHYAMNPDEIVPDAASFGKNTLRGIGQLSVGAAENAYQSVTGKQVPQFNPDGTISYPERGTQEQQVASSFGESVVDAVSHPLETFKNHPLQTLSIAAPLAGSAAKMAGLPRVARVANALDPVQAATKAVPALAKAAGKVGKEVLGKVTGAGGGATQIASEVKTASSPFFQGMRGEPMQQAQQLASDAQRGINILKAKRKADYLKSSEAMRAITEPLSAKPIHSLLSETMDDFRITPKEKSLLDVMRDMTDDQAAQHLSNMLSQPEVQNTLSPLVKAGIGEGATAGKIAKAIGYVERWDEYTPDGLDRLQQSLSSLDPKPGTKEAAFITSLKKGVQQVVKDKYPEYDKMLSTYRDASDQIDELQRAIGNADRQSIEATVRKISQSMKTGNQGFEIRNALISELEKITKVNIRERVAGMAMNQVTPRGLAGVGAGAGVVVGVGLAKLFSPPFLLALGMSSPRVVGEVLANLGIAKTMIAPLTARIRAVMPPSGLMNAAAGASAFNEATK